MKWRWAWSLGLALALSGVAARGQDSLRAFGLEFTVISNAVMAVDDVYAALKVVQVGGPECYYPTGTNDIEDLPFGVSVHLGEAQSGVYVYPNADCRADGRSMWANAYGAVNGETRDHPNAAHRHRPDETRSSAASHLRVASHRAVPAPPRSAH